MPRYLLDVNVLIALSWPSHIHHSRAHAWWSGIGEWATTPITEAAFLRLSINPAVTGRPVTLSEARGVLAAIRSLGGHSFISDDSSLAAPVISLARVTTHAQVTDAHLVNLAAASGVTLATMDAAISDMLEPDDRPHVLVVPGNR